MTTLVACLSSGKGTWVPVLELAKCPSFEQVYLICNPWAQQNFKNQQTNTQLILIDDQQPLLQMIASLQTALKGKILDTEVALNLFSGTGKEHMAILSALLKLGLGIRLVQVQNAQLQEV